MILVLVTQFHVYFILYLGAHLVEVSIFHSDIATASRGLLCDCEIFKTLRLKLY